MGFKMKKPSIIQGTAKHKEAVKDYKELQVNRNMEKNMPDGRSTSSPFQKKETGSPAKVAGIFGRTDEGTWERTTDKEAKSGKYKGTEYTGKDIPRSKTYKDAEKRRDKKSLDLMNKATHSKKVVDKETGETIGSKEDQRRQGETGKRGKNTRNTSPATFKGKPKSPAKLLGAVAGIAGKALAKKAVKKGAEKVVEGDSPAKKTTDTASKKKSSKQKVAEMHEKHKGKKGWQEHVDKTFGGPTTIKDNVSTTRKQAKRTPAKKADVEVWKEDDEGKYQLEKNLGTKDKTAKNYNPRVDLDVQVAEAKAYKDAQKDFPKHKRTEIRRTGKDAESKINTEYRKDSPGHKEAKRLYKERGYL